ncbi:MAG: DMT family transporter [Pseudomonadota bacterium]
MLDRPISRSRAYWERLPSNAKGIAWISVAAVLFAGMTAMIKAAGETIHVTEILLFRQIVMVLIVAPTILADFPASMKSARLDLHIWRIMLAATAMLCGFTAIIHLPLAEATAIGFSKTFFLTIFAILILKETVGARRWSATIVGFVGVIVILRPTGVDAFTYYGLLAIAGAACAGMVMILIRLLARHDRPVTILTYQALFVGLIMLPPAIYFWKTPTFDEFLLLVAIGIISWAAQMCNIQAFKVGEATAIASVDYTRLLYATVIGFVFFAELPDAMTWIGAAIIIGASIYTARREAVRGRQVVRAPNDKGLAG